MAWLVDWLKNYSAVFLLLTALVSMTAKEEYRRYVRFFAEIILVITLVSPVLEAMGKSEDFLDKVSYDSFWQGLDGIKADQEKLEFLKGDSYLRFYEEAIKEDISGMAEDAGYAVLDAGVEMSDSYEVESVFLEVAEQGEEPILVGSIGHAPEDAAVTELKEKIAGYYKVDVGNIEIKD